MSAPAVRAVRASDLDAVHRILAMDPIAHSFVQSRVTQAGADPWRLGGDLWAYDVDGEVCSLLFAGANLVPIQTDEAARAAFVTRLRQAGRRCSSIVGPSTEVLDLWRQLEPGWGPAREVRARQPLLALDREPDVDPDPMVSVSTIEWLDLLLPACIAMFIEEVGVSPVAGGAGSAYRARIAELIRSGRSLARLDAVGEGRPEVVFKAEIGVATDQVCQVQGVFVEPAWRGRGIAAPAMAAVVAHCRQSIAPMVSLYVNDYNTPARKAYARVGFEPVGCFATVLF